MYVKKILADDDFCLALKKSGCVMLKLGIESGDQEVLDQLNKGIDLPTASAVLKSLKRAGIATYVYLLFGTPPESKENAIKTLDFAIEHRDCIDFLNLAIFNLPYVMKVLFLYPPTCHDANNVECVGYSIQLTSFISLHS